jgi:hypothetical protein
MAAILTLFSGLNTTFVEDALRKDEKGRKGVRALLAKRALTPFGENAGLELF